MTKHCKRCKATYLINRPIKKKIKNKNFLNYCLVCWIYLDREKCREERRKALGIK